MASETSDQELMTRFGQRGDAEAFAELARRWDGRVFGFLLKACGDPEAAADLRQEVFIRLHRYGHTFDPKYPFTSWLFRIASNALKTWQMRRNRLREFIGGDEDEATPEAVDHAPGPRELAVRGETGERVRALLGRLKAEERQLLLLRFDLDLNFGRIGEILGAPETTVKSRFHALLARLRRQLEESETMERK